MLLAGSRTGAEWCVEREGAWFDFGQRQRMLVGARHLLAEDAASGIRVVIDQVDDDSTAGQLQRGFNRIGQSSDDVWLSYQAVDDHRDVVLEGLFERGGIGEGNHFTVYHRTGIALSAQVAKEVDKLALLLVDDLRQNLKTGSLGQLENLIHDLLRGLLDDLFTAVCAEWHSDARPKQAQVVVDFGDGSDRRARVAVGRFLVDRNGWTQAFDKVNVWSVDLPQELTGVSTQ